MPLPPIEPGQAGMTRRNFLVERNRLRVSQYEVTRKALEEEDIRLAKKRQEQRQAMQDTWRKGTGVGQTDDRPLPGGGPRSQRMKDTANQRHANDYQLQKVEEARKKAEYNKLYKADMKEQLTLHQETVKKIRADEHAQMAALRAINEEADQKAADAEFKLREENKAYMQRMRQSNIRELEVKRLENERKEAADLAIFRLAESNNNHRHEMEKRQQKNILLMNYLQNEQYNKEAMKRNADNQTRDAEELAKIVERDLRLAREEIEANKAKKERFKQELDDCVRRDKEYRRLHNYDEPEYVARQRNELAAQSYRLIRQEEALRDAERKAEYKRDLMNQIVAKHQYQMTHLDGL